MSYRTDFYKLLSDQEFQNGIFNFDSFDKDEQKEIIQKYSLNKDEFIKANTVLTGLTFKKIDFSDDELNYLWKKLGISENITSHKQRLKARKLIDWFSKVAAILFIPLIITSIWFFTKTRDLNSFKEEKINQLAEMYNTVYSPVGGKTKAVLPDGSEVWLNSGSSLRYPILAKQGFREVELTGEGFFKVKKDPDKPLLVNTSGMQVKVYGTTFNINAYEENPDIQTVLVEGKISLKKLDKEGKPIGSEYKIRPGELGRLDRQNNTVVVTKANNMEVFTGWVNGKYVFKNTQFKNILSRLERIHNVEFVLEDNALGDYYFDATFENQNIERIMEIFAVSLPIKWTSVKAEQNKDKTFTTRKIIISTDKKRELL